MRREPARMGYMVVFTNPGFIMQTLCFKSHLAFFAGMVGEGIYIYIWKMLVEIFLMALNYLGKLWFVDVNIF